LRLARLEVVDFRNHPAASLDLEPGPNLLVGQNGVGKTNLLEAIGYLATLGSYRASSDAALVRSGAEAAVIRALALRAGRRILLELEIRPGSGLRGRLNRSPVPRARDLLGAVRAVVFAPEDLALIRGDPDERRRFLDSLAVQRLPRYHAIKQDFDRILRQRNTLLRSAGGRQLGAGAMATLDVWDDRLATAGAAIWAQRLEVVDALRPLVIAAYRELAGREEPVDLDYSSSLGDEVPSAAGAELDELARQLKERMARDRTRELERGVTLSGPHRDDLVLRINDLPARTHASHGEAWSLALGLRLASHRWLASEGEVPLLLLDDVFAELDRARRRRLAEAAVGVEQVIVTAAVLDEVPDELRATIFRVSAGSAVRDPAPGADAGASERSPGPEAGAADRKPSAGAANSEQEAGAGAVDSEREAGAAVQAPAADADPSGRTPEPGAGAGVQELMADVDPFGRTRGPETLAAVQEPAADADPSGRKLGPGAESAARPRMADVDPSRRTPGSGAESAVRQPAAPNTEWREPELHPDVDAGASGRAGAGERRDREAAPIDLDAASSASPQGEVSRETSVFR
jgi:DNA replication and repair protein RecF